VLQMVNKAAVGELYGVGEAKGWDTTPGIGIWEGRRGKREDEGHQAD
jgi:hypothetical protein